MRNYVLGPKVELGKKKVMEVFSSELHQNELKYFLKKHSYSYGSLFPWNVYVLVCTYIAIWQKELNHSIHMPQACLFHKLTQIARSLKYVFFASNHNVPLSQTYIFDFLPLKISWDILNLQRIIRNYFSTFIEYRESGIWSLFPIILQLFVLRFRGSLIILDFRN